MNERSNAWHSWQESYLDAMARTGRFTWKEAAYNINNIAKKTGKGKLLTYETVKHKAAATGLCKIRREAAHHYKVSVWQRYMDNENIYDIAESIGRSTAFVFLCRKHWEKENDTVIPVMNMYWTSWQDGYLKAMCMKGGMTYQDMAEKLTKISAKVGYNKKFTKKSLPIRVWSKGLTKLKLAADRDFRVAAYRRFVNGEKRAAIALDIGKHESYITKCKKDYELYGENNARTDTAS